MDELVGRLVADLGIDREVAAKAVGIILAFLVKEGPPDKVKALLDGLPGSAAVLQSAADVPASAFGMGGIMGAGTQLMALGLGMGQVQGVTRLVMAYAREKAGDDAVGEIVGAIPGPGGVFVFAAGLALVLQNSEWAKRQYVKFKKKHPNKGRWADWGMRRLSARRREERLKRAEAEEAASNAPVSD